MSGLHSAKQYWKKITCQNGVRSMQTIPRLWLFNQCLVLHSTTDSNQFREQLKLQAWKLSEAGNINHIMHSRKDFLLWYQQMNHCFGDGEIWLLSVASGSIFTATERTYHCSNYPAWAIRCTALFVLYQWRSAWKCLVLGYIIPNPCTNITSNSNVIQYHD